MLPSTEEGMTKEIPQVFARRARLSSKAIFTAVALTLAALIAMAIASRRETQTSVKTISPVTQLPAESDSLLVPVVSH
ncbi:hypothetical protein [Hyphomicrobium sp.]|uniref:hypothetical protein n=1 Tax=Hyphomicrobium sp. TaxID=82 RepID=UPI002D770F81|nr:hypothetical protein [Hyphomicrobium sp.]HET6389757.1 hypothetical protein [Hyphomicrobium sp.]